MNEFMSRRTRKDGPEQIIQKGIIHRLKMLGWYVRPTHGNAYQNGFPDLFACHTHYGHRWIEVKLPGMKGSRFTESQIEVFPELCKHGSGVWVLTGDSEDEIGKLNKPCNWALYLGFFS